MGKYGLGKWETLFIWRYKKFCWYRRNTVVFSAYKAKSKGRWAQNKKENKQRGVCGWVCIKGKAGKNGRKYWCGNYLVKEKRQKQRELDMNNCSIKTKRKKEMCEEVNLLEVPQRKEEGKYQKNGYKNKLANITSILQ